MPSEHVPLVGRSHPMLPESESQTVCARCNEPWPCEVTRLREIERQFHALLNTLAPSKSSWIQHVVRNARAALTAVRAGEKK